MYVCIPALPAGPERGLCDSAVHGALLCSPSAGLMQGFLKFITAVQGLKSASEDGVAMAPSGCRQMRPKVSTQALSDLALSGVRLPTS